MTATSVLAQQQSSAVYVPPVLERQREMRQRDILVGDLEGRPERLIHQRYIQAVLAQLNQDFNQIQVLRNKLVPAASANNALDYKHIANATAEIRKRASRLKSNLALPDSESDEKKLKDRGEFNDQQIKEALVMLCHRIESFITNPVFETPGLIDVQLSAKASRDLKRVVQLSGSIRKSAERLTKTLR